MVDRQQNEIFNELIAHKILFNLNQKDIDTSSEKAQNDKTNNKSNKKQQSMTNEKLLTYSTMIYPLYPMYSSAVRQANEIADKSRELSLSSSRHERNHIVDVVFIHGLRGSVFYTWRQDDSKPTTNNDNNNATLKTETGPQTTANLTPVETNRASTTNSNETNFIEALNNLIARYFDIHSNCWPKDWLPLDIVEKINVPTDEFEIESEGLVDLIDLE